MPKIKKSTNNNLEVLNLTTIPADVLDQIQAIVNNKFQKHTRYIIERNETSIQKGPYKRYLVRFSINGKRTETAPTTSKAFAIILREFLAFIFKKPISEPRLNSTEIELFLQAYPLISSNDTTPLITECLFFAKKNGKKINKEILVNISAQNICDMQEMLKSAPLVKKTKKPKIEESSSESEESDSEIEDELSTETPISLATTTTASTTTTSPANYDEVEEIEELKIPCDVFEFLSVYNTLLHPQRNRSFMPMYKNSKEEDNKDLTRRANTAFKYS